MSTPVTPWKSTQSDDAAILANEGEDWTCASLDFKQLSVSDKGASRPCRITRMFYAQSHGFGDEMQL